jgi:OFA family oxalate/formate antiporter-like MFS transporter
MSSTAAASAAATTQAPASKRWSQLIAGVLCCALVANLQYGWTLFVDPISKKYGWTNAAIQVAFTIFILVETWLVPVEGYLVDKYGPSIVTIGGAVLCAAGWAINSVAASLPMLYLGAVVGGIGAGSVYGTCVAHAVRWFPDRRGLAAGLTSAGFGAGAGLTVIPIANMIDNGAGYERAFLVFGLLQGLGVLLLAFVLAAPRPGEVPPPKLRRVRGRDATIAEVLRSPAFWVMYMMFVSMAIGGLTITAQLKPIGTKYGIANTAVTLLWTGTAATLALSYRSFTNGISRPFFGWISDHLGRENTMCVAFALEGLAFLGFVQYGKTPMGFVVFAALVFLFYGEIFSLFPATVGDLFGSKYMTTNAGSMYTAKGTASLIVPIGGVIAAKTGGWDTMFYIIIALNFFAAFSALFILKPVVRRMIERQATEAGAGSRPG